MYDPLEYEVSRITIRRFLDEDSEDVFTVEAVTPAGDTLPLIESLGLLALAQADLISEMNLPDAEE